MKAQKTKKPENRFHHSKATLFATALLAAMANGALSDVITFGDQASFQTAFSSRHTFDFEPASGFPSDPGVGANPFIGLFAGINFNAAVSVYPFPSSGVQVMTGYTGDQGQGGRAIIDFAGLSAVPSGIGFFATDQNTATSIILTTFYTGGGSDVFTITQPVGVPNFTPFFFGVLNSSDTISRVQLNGCSDDTSIGGCAWSIDDLSIGLMPVPEPSSLLLCATALGLFTLVRFRRWHQG